MSTAIASNEVGVKHRLGPSQALAVFGRRLRVLVSLVTLCCTLLWSGGARAGGLGHGKTLFGGLTTHQVECPTLCTEGNLTGGLSGLLEFEMDSMSETNNPDVVTYIGTNTITRANGSLSGTDYGIWNLVTGEFTDVTLFSSGTGDYEGVSGIMVIAGTFDVVSGTGSSRYVSVIYLQ